MNIFRKKEPKRQRITTIRPDSRADVVRTRRVNVQKEQTEKKVERLKTAAVGAPVITMRTGVMGTPVVNRASTHPRLKLNLPLNQRGVEMRLPAIPAIKPSWRMLSGSLVVVLVAVLVYMMTTPIFVVKNPTFVGLKRLKSSDFDAALVFANPRIFFIEPEVLVKQIKAAFPELKDVSVDVSFPAKITISVVERQPVVTWKNQDMQMWIDNEGVLFPSHGEAETLLNISSDGTPPMVQPLFKPNLLVDGIVDMPAQTDAAKKDPSKSTQVFVDRNVLNSAILLYQQVPPNTTILYNKTRGLGWVDQNGWNVYLGFDLGQLDEKMLVYKKIVQTVKLSGIHPKLISVEYVNAPYYRLE